MHEFGVVRDVFNKVAKTGKTKRAVVVLGVLKGVDSAMFKEMWQSLAKGSPLEKMEVKVRTVPLKVRCSKCKLESIIADVPHLHSVFITWPCPECGGDAELLSGNEMEITELE